MSKLEKLDLLGVASLAAVTGALLVGWMVSTHAAAQHEHHAAPAGSSVTFTNDGHMKLTVTAERGNEAGPSAARTHSASVRPYGGPTLDAVLPVVLRF